VQAADDAKFAGKDDAKFAGKDSVLGRINRFSATFLGADRSRPVGRDVSSVPDSPGRLRSIARRKSRNRY
jgi:hypothetical protein